jgi:NDP-sugar pyrophosphorylase family protein
MKYAIIAAGEGSRLAQEGVTYPKPLVRLHGEPMIDRLVRIFNANDAEEICIIVNTLHPQTEAHVRQLMEHNGGAPIRLVVQTTPSSMHSFAALAPYLGEAPFGLTTVDTIFREDEFARYIAAFTADADIDGLMAVTDYIDDEKPLYVATDADLRITGFLDSADDCRYISGGIYALRPSALATLQRCLEEGQSRMRNFQRGLVADGRQLKAFPMSKILDVDHADDIAKAEAFLHSAPRP